MPIRRVADSKRLCRPAPPGATDPTSSCRTSHSLALDDTRRAFLDDLLAAIGVVADDAGSTPDPFAVDL